MTSKVNKDSIRDGYRSVISGLSSNLSKQTLTKIDSIDVCLFGSASMAVLGVDVDPKDLDFHIKFNFSDKILSNIVEKKLYSDSGMKPLKEDEINYFSKQSVDIKSAVNEIVKLFSKQQELINSTIMSVKRIDVMVDITADKMMFNSTFCSMDVGRVGDIEYTQNIGNNSKFNLCLMSLEKSFIRKLTSSRDKDSQSLSKLAKNIDIEILIATVRQMQFYNSKEMMSELGSNLMGTAHESTSNVKECCLLYNRYTELITDVTKRHYHESHLDIDCFKGLTIAEESNHLSVNEERTLALHKANSSEYYSEAIDLNFENQ